MRAHFRPDTKIDTYRSLAMTGQPERGSRSRASLRSVIWVELDMIDPPPADRCCHECNPELAIAPVVRTLDDPLLTTYASEFIFPLATVSERPSSAQSNRSDDSTVSEPAPKVRGTTTDQKSRLSDLLVKWRKEYHTERGYGSFSSPKLILPDACVMKLVEKCYLFLQHSDVNRKDILGIIQWDLAADTDVDGVLTVIRNWCRDERLNATPKKAKPAAKRARVANASSSRAPQDSNDSYGRGRVLTDVTQSRTRVVNIASGTAFADLSAAASDALFFPTRSSMAINNSSLGSSIPPSSFFGPGAEEPPLYYTHQVVPFQSDLPLTNRFQSVLSRPSPFSGGFMPLSQATLPHHSSHLQASSSSRPLADSDINRG